jgi:predicted metalloprotease
VRPLKRWGGLIKRQRWFFILRLSSLRAESQVQQLGHFIVRLIKRFTDLSFFEDLQTALASGFCILHVIAHEVGHHVQTLLISGKVNDLMARASTSERNKLSVRMELQADCFAGVWGRQADESRQILEAGDVEEALNAASQIGDDRIQKRTQGQVVPDAFTHGSAAQRVRWFKLGFETGNLQACDTFNTDRL